VVRPSDRDAGDAGLQLKQPFLARHANPRSIEARDALVDFYSIAPGIMGGSDAKAREQAQAIAAMDAMRGHLALGRLAARAKDTTTCVREMNAAIAAAPDSLRPYWAFAKWYLNEKKWSQAFATMDRYLEKHPDDLYARYDIGRIAAESGLELERGDQAIRAFLAAPPRGVTPPVLSRAYLRLGQILDHRGQQAEARRAFEQALEIDPRNKDAKNALK
jgi:tetratricopeptide (TPR) repeat protein